ncbi:ATP-binding cassette domain-containing protein [Actinophytocola sp.]|uniref:ATP-binding cassette domain-containing protein n=1 Tax=Actinophytocola sp. TaxID=1872138 RepID=UPI00389A6BEE
MDRKRSLTCSAVALTGLTAPFDLEVWFRQRVAVLGGNGSGKSRFLHLLAEQDVPHTGTVELAPGWCRACSPRRTRVPTSMAAASRTSS